MLERNGHGGDLATAEELFGVPVRQMLDFSANINPMGPPPGLKDILLAEWEGLVHYPDPESRELRSAISQKYNIDPSSILVGNGAAEVIDLIVRGFKPGKVAVVDPAFREYAEASLKAGAEMLPVPASAEDAFAIPVEALLAACEEADLLFVGQPNNPTGQWLDREAVARLADTAATHQTVVVLDEAFIDFFEDESELSFIREAANSRHVIVIRSMTKFYGIPGLRLGYAVAHPDNISFLRRLQVPWSVNYLAQKAGVFALNQTGYEERTKQLVALERSWLTEELRSIGCQPFPGKANFMLVRTSRSGPAAEELQHTLGKQGILIRRCAGFAGLDDRYFRIAVRTRPENERLIAALRCAILSRREAEGTE
ncbi:threonine-phosphate decarboxylase [Paenibacillus forsythiae]|uniref:threonine-phosphate decarboxylase n=1 Tax=Paenibacillus forsythiae TaxID=365616 RepID=A0ABU3HDP7_9BACL|nr:threonine-phosphate decarboxylase CobD [Paenibacillus forsythiae]MDT3428929.1 threonine-phosphate decarboxylase [Paenibacillus forsythiae]